MSVRVRIGRMLEEFGFIPDTIGRYEESTLWRISINKLKELNLKEPAGIKVAATNIILEIGVPWNIFSKWPRRSKAFVERS